MSHHRLAPFKLDVIIVGGAVAGLSTAIGLAMSGHKVRVLERSSKLGKPVGGIRLPPNVTKVLVQWGLEEELRRRASLVRGGTNIWDLETGRLLGYLEWAEPVIQDSGAKFYMMRYSDLHEILYSAAVKAGAEVIFNVDVCLVSPPLRPGTSTSGSTPCLPRERPSVLLSDGTVLEADIVIGADGQYSVVRSSLQEKRVEPQITGTIVFTGSVPMKRLLEDDLIKAENLTSSWVYWLGPRRSFTGYPISHETEFAVHLYVDRNDPDAPEGWTPNVSAKSLKLSDTILDRKYSWVFEKVDSVCWQRYLDWPKIENWSDKSNRIVLIGESSRPLIPCSTHSCSVSVESAAVFSTLLSYVRNLDHIPLLVRAYETIRRDRTEFLHQVEVQSVLQTMFPPGPERTARNKEMERLLRARQGKWDDDAYLGLWGQLCEIWAYNAFDAADDWWVQWGVLRERALSLQNPNIETPFRRLEVNISARTDMINIDYLDH
ncbi:hypothetical protein B0F90DRAFT_1623939 [Multifurca ochricompacta]|uniref:FAD-binding domain-containing protein n=1 Tax=Multifurca ochricompacta TaxID=376703 RepID=A0AAD4QR80_9AGAM|nr:hypothetical protein B0F90DRAFT_1623939 [Multifurca ochricompacta]